MSDLIKSAVRDLQQKRVPVSAQNILKELADQAELYGVKIKNLAALRSEIHDYLKKFPPDSFSGNPSRLPHDGAAAQPTTLIQQPQDIIFGGTVTEMKLEGPAIFDHFAAEAARELAVSGIQVSAKEVGRLRGMGDIRVMQLDFVFPKGHPWADRPISVTLTPSEIQNRYNKKNNSQPFMGGSHLVGIETAAIEETFKKLTESVIDRSLTERMVSALNLTGNRIQFGPSPSVNIDAPQHIPVSFGSYKNFALNHLFTESGYSISTDYEYVIGRLAEELKNHPTERADAFRQVSDYCRNLGLHAFLEDSVVATWVRVDPTFTP